MTKRSSENIPRNGRSRRKHVPNFSCLSTEISHSPASPRIHLGACRLLNLAGRQKLLPNSICLSTRPLSLLPWKKSSHFRRFSEPVSKFRRPNANRSRLRFLRPPIFLSYEILVFLSSTLLHQDMAKRSHEHIVESRFSCPSSTSSLRVTRQQLVDRINGELNRFLMTRASFSTTKHPDDNMRSLLCLLGTMFTDINSVD